MLTHHFKAISYKAIQPGPRLLVLGAVHGNETAGTRGIQRVLGEIDARILNLAAGSVTFVPITNPMAYELGQRAGERNLNRNLGPSAEPREFEDHIANWLCPLMTNHDVLLDLHSFQAVGRAFVMVGPENNTEALEPFAHAEAEVALALRLGVSRFVDGWLGTYARGVARRRATIVNAARREQQLDTDPRYGVGTTEYMRSVGGYALTLECGQHDDPHAPEVAYRAIRNTLAHLGHIDAPKPAVMTDIEALRIYEVIDRAHGGDQFSRPWSSFDPLRAGDLIGTRHDGSPLQAQTDGYILFPNAKAGIGHEWFYLARANPRLARN
ncbi:MAG: succinylglutamate desuccinylase [Rhodoferax sp.]